MPFFGKWLFGLKHISPVTLVKSPEMRSMAAVGVSPQVNSNDVHQKFLLPMGLSLFFNKKIMATLSPLPKKFIMSQFSQALKSFITRISVISICLFKNNTRPDDSITCRVKCKLPQLARCECKSESKIFAFYFVSFSEGGKTYQKERGLKKTTLYKGTEKKLLPSPPISNNSTETAIKRNCQLAVIPSPSKLRPRKTEPVQAGQMV